jgi:hypothetical protein
MNENWPLVTGEDMLVGLSVGTALVLGSLALGLIARRGRAPRAVSVTYWLLVAYAVSLVFASTVLLVLGHRDGLWYGLAGGGLVGAIALVRNSPSMWRARRDAEERRMVAHDL